MIHSERPTAFLNLYNVVVDHNLFEILHNAVYEIWASLFSTFQVLFRELFGRSNLGEGALKTEGIDIRKLIVIRPHILKDEMIKKILEKLSLRDTKPLFTELGINPSLPIRSQEPNPLPDRKALDDIIFDILGLTEDERREVYWAVCELVKNRLEKARSV